MTRLQTLLLALAGETFLISCNRSVDPAPHQTRAQPSGSSVIVEPLVAPGSWLGLWTGPEGTSLLLSKTEANRYEVTIRSLDGVATYPGVWLNNGIDFSRAGQNERVRAGTGKDTGMKWLLEKKNCLVVRLSEGFCRD